MTILIVGAGAMGCLFASLLAPAGHRVVIVEKDRDRASAIRLGGITIERDGRETVTRVSDVMDNACRAGTADLVLLVVKSYDTQEAVQASLPAIGPDTMVLTLQNGLGNIEAICGQVQRRQILAGTTAQGATLLGNGRARHAGQGPTVIGALEPGQAARAEAVCGLFNRCGIPTEVTGDVRSVLWGKLLVNAGINALTAIMGCPNGLIVQHHDLRQLMACAVREGAAIAARLGIRLPYGDPVSRTEEVCRLTAANSSSMLQDIGLPRQTEINSINGQLVAYGRSLGMPVPVNQFLTLLVRALEPQGPS